MSASDALVEASVPVFPWEFRLCLKDQVLPLSTVSMDLVDMHNLLESGDQDDVEFQLLSLQTHSNVGWLMKTLQAMGVQVGSAWWLLNSVRIPLLMEIREAIQKGKKTSGAERLLPRRPDTVVPVTLRGTCVLVVNHPNKTTVALEHGREIIMLDWLLKHLQEDIMKMLQSQEPGADPASSSAGPASSSSGPVAPGSPERSLVAVPSEPSSPERPHMRVNTSKAPEDEVILEACLSELKMHGNCLAASFMPSRVSLRVNRNDKQVEQFIVQNLKKKRQEAVSGGPGGWDGVKASYHKALQEALQFLDRA